MEVVITLIVAALLGLIPAKIAQSKGYSFGKWWVYGFLIFIVAIIHACVLKPTGETKTNTKGSSLSKASAGDTKKCPYCAETIKSEAAICRFCGKELPEEESALAESNSMVYSPQDEATINVTAIKSRETPLMNVLITIIAIPLTLFVGPFVGITNMDTQTWLSTKFGYKTKRCRRCGKYFNAESSYCQGIEGKRHCE